MTQTTTGLSEAKRALLAKYLQGSTPQTAKETQLISRNPQSGNAPLSYGQQQIWLLAQILPERPVYTECVTIHLPGQLRIGALEHCFNIILQRHDAWRTTFPMIDGQPVQVVHPYTRLPLSVIDLTGLPEGEREKEALRLAEEEAQHPFDLANGPLLRPMLIKLSDVDHRLFLTLHHIIFDGFSLYQIFLPELRSLYDAFLAGRPSPLPEMPIQYTDFAVWQRKWLQEHKLAEDLSYWKQQLQNIPANLDLPLDHPRPVVSTYRGSMHSFALSKKLTQAIKTLGRKEGVTLYMTLLASFKALLYRYTGQEDILLGTAISDRNLTEVQGLMGFFLNTLVLRTDLSNNPTFQDLLIRVRDVVLEAHAHQNVPFEFLVKELHPERTLRQNPLFQVLFSLEPPLAEQPEGWTLTQMDVETDTAKFDLSIELDDRPDGLIGRFEYNTDLFDASTIARMVGHWLMLLESIVADPAQHIADLPLLTVVERQQLLVEWNDTAVDYPKHTYVHQLFEAQVERTPDAVAAVFQNEQLTYRELNVRANQLAHCLQSQGVGPEVLVGLCVERSLHLLVGLLGILKAGGAYVPLDPTFPQERIHFMVQDAQVPLLVTQHHLVEKLAVHNTATICLDTDVAGMARQNTTNPAPSATSDSLAYVIYTSGSTGRPKGVQIPHSAFVNFLTTMSQKPGMTAEDVLVAVTTLSFDIAALELFLPLLVGARIIIPEREIVTNGEKLAELLIHSSATVMQATPITWHLLLASGWQGNPNLKILCGGEALPLELARQLLSKCSSLWNMYGPTETTIWSAVHQIQPEDTLITIGRPIANTQMYILDPHMQLMPINVPGELYIGGDGLAREYLHRPELTAERFVPHPFNDTPDARLYKTGDTARYKADGTIEVLGRSDYQVKLRGYRIELGEIETVLEQHPDVRQAVVVMREDVPGDKHLVAYLVLHKQQATVVDLKKHVMDQLPIYMVPSTFVVLEKFPQTLNGKVERRSLPAPEQMTHTTEDIYTLPTTIVHFQLIQIWEELLTIRPIGIRDNFFNLGGHSLLAARLIARIEQVFGQKLPLSSLFAGPTIEQLANALQQQEEASSSYPLVAVQTSGIKKPFFFLHGDWTQGAFYCFTLASASGKDQPFYALEPYKVDGMHIPTSLEEMAAAHLTSLRALQPEGPYFLGGFCNGGLLAYEMARQLHAQRHQVDLLLLINPSVPTYMSFLRNIINPIGDFMRLDQEKRANWFLSLRHALRHIYRQLHSSNDERLQDFEKLLHIDSRLHRMFPPIEALRKDYIGIFTWLATGYALDHYSASKITFFWASEEPFNRIGWQKATKSIETESFIISGSHMDIVTKQINTLSQDLGMCLSKAQANQLDNLSLK